MGKSSGLSYGWVVVGVGALMTCVAFGSMLSLAVFLQPISQDMGWSRSGVSAVYINGKIVVFGGEATGKVFGTNEAYDPKTDSWEALTPMAVPRHGLHGATAAVIGNMVHVPGGVGFFQDVATSFVGQSIILRSIGRTSVLA